MCKEYEVDVYGLAYGGMGIASLEGKICFVEGALPGEKVRFVKKSEKNRYIIGTAAQILNASEWRVSPVCPYYAECGGCQYQHLDYAKEVFYKGEQVKEALDRIGGLKDYNFEGIVPSPLQYGYRTSVTLHRFPAGYGFVARNKNTVIPIKDCPLAAAPINQAISMINSSEKKRDITIKCDSSGNAWISGHAGHRFFKEEFMGEALTFSPKAFSQVNRGVARLMVKKLEELVKKEENRHTLFDLYCGTGFLSISLRRLFKSIVGIDESRVAIACAKTAKRELAAGNIKFYCADAETNFPLYYKKLRGSTNTIIIDPPRSGIKKGLAEDIAGLEGAASLYYISCDPTTLARDAKLITQSQAWKLESVFCFDMFPRTKHIESIAIFKKLIS